MDWNIYESTYGRRYPLEHNGHPYQSHQQQWEPYYQPWNSFDQGNFSLDIDYNQPYSSTYYDEPSHMFHEKQAGNYFSEPCNPYFSWDSSQDEISDLKDLLHRFLENYDAIFKSYEQKDLLYNIFEKFDETFKAYPENELLLEIKSDFEKVKRHVAKLMRQEAWLKRQQHAELIHQLRVSPIELFVESNEETDISQSIPCESEEEVYELEGEEESMAEAIEEGKDEVTIEQFEEFPTEKPLETRVEDKTEIGYSNFEIDEFVIPPYVPSHHLELKILLGQVKGEGRWLIQLKIYFLEATKGKERILSSTPNFFMFSMKHCKGIKFLMHGWHNFPFDPGGVEQWSG